MDHNIKFSIPVINIDARTRRPIPSSTEFNGENIPGHWEEIAPTLESEIAQGNAQDRVIRYKLTCELTDRLTTVLIAGCYIVVTHRLNLRTNRMTEVTENEQYVVNKVDSTYGLGPTITLGLVRRDQS